MNKNAKALTLDGEGFAALKSDFNPIFNALIETMLNKEAEKGTISIKLDITLENGHAPDRSEVRYAAEREIISPKIEHTITSTFQIKDKRTGLTGGDTFEIFWARDDGCWAITKITDAQRSLFDKGEDQDGEQDAGDDPAIDDDSTDGTEADDGDYPNDGGDADGDVEGGYAYDQPENDADGDGGGDEQADV